MRKSVSLLLAFVTGFTIAAVIVLALARMGSGLYVAQRLSEEGNAWALAGAISLRNGDYLAAEEKFRSELSLQQFREADQDWPLLYPLAATILNRISGTLSTGRSDADKAKAMIELRLAYVLEKRGELDEADRHFRTAATTLGTNDRVILENTVTEWLQIVVPNGK